jgi:predicted nucleic acid-binding protein
MYLLDTNVVSELRKVRTGKAHPGVAAWATGIPVSTMFMSVVTLQELESGVLLVERWDARVGLLLRAWLDGSVQRVFVGRILPVDEAVARRAGALHVPDPAPHADALIAATALVHGLALVTRNVCDFERFVGLRVVDPWADATA